MHHRGDPNAFVLNPGGQAVARPSQQPGEQEPITHTFQLTTSYFHCKEYRSFYPHFNYEVVKVQATSRNAQTPPDTFHILNFPIDQLNQHITERATRLSNLRRISFHNPLSWQAFIMNYGPLTEMALYILTRVHTLTRITLCADMLNDRFFQALSEKLYLKEVEILLPPLPFPFENRLADIGAVLNRGIIQLSQVEIFKIPFELVTNTLIACFSRLPYLQVLEITGSANVPYPGRYFIACMGYLHIQNPRIFENLQILDVSLDHIPHEDFFSKDTLTKILPNTKFIKT